MGPRGGVKKRVVVLRHIFFLSILLVTMSKNMLMYLAGLWSESSSTSEFCVCEQQRLCRVCPFLEDMSEALLLDNAIHTKFSFVNSCGNLLSEYLKLLT